MVGGFPVLTGIYLAALQTGAFDEPHSSRTTGQAPGKCLFELFRTWSVICPKNEPAPCHPLVLYLLTMN